MFTKVAQLFLSLTKPFQIKDHKSWGILSISSRTSNLICLWGCCSRNCKLCPDGNPPQQPQQSGPVAVSGGTSSWSPGSAPLPFPAVEHAWRIGWKHENNCPMPVTSGLNSQQVCPESISFKNRKAYRKWVRTAAGSWELIFYGKNVDLTMSCCQLKFVQA